MHGRVRVRTTAEEAARKKKELEEHAKAYRKAMDRIAEKRKAGELDDEMMQLTANILSKNPDIVTLWEIRKECILHTTKDVEKKCQQLYEKELGFAASCLHVQPKCYPAFHHRCWILENCPSPNWKQEIDLCTKYLKMDERNFHVWDYRRYVVKKANVSAEDEFAFCTEKIQKNFSNYSSWHYRSQLLPVLFPHETDKSRPISEDKLKEELELVLTAAFTDPNDSSAWFYQRWLLGYSHADFDFAALRLTSNQLIVAFTRPVDLNEKAFKLKLGDIELSEWQTANNQRNGVIDANFNEPNTVWSTSIESQPSECNLVELIDPKGRTYSMEVNRISNGYYGIKMPKFGYEFGAAVLEELQTQLNSCNLLLEYEPDSKWTLLTAALLMRALDRNLHHDKSLEYLQKLEEVDFKRKGYYSDLASKWKIEKFLFDWIDANDCDADVNLSGLGLTTIYYEQYFSIATKINLSDNCLPGRIVHKFGSFVNCEKLDLKDNNATIATFPKILNLRSLFLTGNFLENDAKNTIHANNGELVELIL